jgi:hypothetical protein
LTRISRSNHGRKNNLKSTKWNRCNSVTQCDFHRGNLSQWVAMGVEKTALCISLWNPEISVARSAGRRKFFRRCDKYRGIPAIVAPVARRFAAPDGSDRKAAFEARGLAERTRLPKG